MVALWDTESADGTVAGHPFGLRSAVVNFNRVEAYMVYIERKLGLVPSGHYFEVVCEPAGGKGGKAPTRPTRVTPS